MSEKDDVTFIIITNLQTKGTGTHHLLYLSFYKDISPV